MSDYLQIVCSQCNAINRLPRNKLHDQGNCGRCKQSLFSGKPIELTSANFHRYIQFTEIPLVIDFWADWCGPCKSFAPVFKQAAKQLEPGARFAKVDTEAQQDIAAQFQIRSIPTLIVISDGQEIARQAGAMSLPQFEQWVKPYLIEK